MSIITPMIRRQGALIAVVIFLMPAVVRAGYYAAGTTSGLAMTVSGGGKTITPGSGAISGTASGGNGSVVTSGTISTTFTWHRNTIDGGEPDPDDNPPDYVVVVESCSVSSNASAYGSSTPSTSANNGLNTTTINQTTPILTTIPVPPYTMQIGTNGTSTCNGSRAQVVAGGNSVTVNGTTISGGASTPNGPFSMNVSYSAGVYPIKLSVGGAVLDEGTLYGEVGRLHSGSLSTTAPNTTFSNWQWSVGGSDAFKSYSHGSAAQVTSLTSADLSIASPGWHWRQGKSETVSVEAQVNYNGASIGTVDESVDVSVEAPTPVWQDFTASGLSSEVHYGLASNGNPSCVDATGDPVGIHYSFGGAKCPHFANGTVFCAQLIDAYWYFDGALYDRWSTTSSNYDLDTSYPYNLTFTTYDPAVFTSPVTTEDSDTPSYWSTMLGAAQVTTSFQIYLMYQSSDPSEQDVALYTQAWDWNGSSTDATPPASPTAGSSGAFTYQPTWPAIFTP